MIDPATGMPEVPADVRIVMMQGAPQFYWQMAYLAARVTVENSQQQRRKGWWRK